MKKLSLKNKIVLFLSIPLLCVAILTSFLFTSDVKTENAFADNVDSSTYISQLLADDVVLGSSYDLDSYYPILPENQTNSDLCWIYSSLKVLETSLMKQRNEYHNFSETGMAYLNYVYNTLNSDNMEEMKIIDKSGNFAQFNSIAENYGLVYENSFSNDIFFDLDEQNYENYNYVLDYIDNEIMDSINQIIIHEDLIYTEANRELKEEILKRYVYKYGGVFAGLEKGIISNENKLYYRTDVESENDRDGAVTTNHAICIVGWNDEMDCGDMGKGAFRVLNSWGVSSTSYSYFYVPYSYLYLYQDVYGYICLEDNADYTQISSTAGGNDGFSSKFMNENAVNPNNLFIFGEEFEIVYNFSDKFNFESIFVNIYQGQSNVTSRFTLDFDDENRNVTITISDNLKAVEGFVIEFYDDTTYVGKEDFYIFTGTEVSYVQFKDGSAKQLVDSTLFNNNLASGNFSQTYYVYNTQDLDYYLDFYLPGLKNYTYEKVSLSVGEIYITSTNNGVTTTRLCESTDLITASVEPTQFTISNRVQVKIKHLIRKTSGKLVEFKVNVLSKSGVGTGKISTYNFKFYISSYDKAKTENTNKIVYELNGGENNIRNINRYPLFDKESSITAFELYKPTKANSNFIGWYLDKDFNVEVISIDANLSNLLTNGNDIVIYARWEVVDLNYFDISLGISKIEDYEQNSKSVNDFIIYGDTVTSKLVFVPELENLTSYKYTTNYTYYFNDTLVEKVDLDALGDTVYLTNNFLKNGVPYLVCGNYNIKVKVFMVVSHQFSVTKELEINYTVNQKEITVTFDNNSLNYVYDRNYHKPVVTKLNGIYAEDGIVNFEMDRDGEKDFGEYTYNVISVDNDNYKIAENQNCKMSISKANISIEWLNTTKPYNGERQEPTYKLNDVIEGDTVIVQYGLKENLAVEPELKKVGTYNIAVRKISSTNYQLVGNTECTFTIEKVNIKIKFENKSARFTLSPMYRPAITWTIEGQLYDDESALNISYSCDAIKAEESGDYPITGAYDNPNYNAEIISGTYTILGYYYVYYTLPDGSTYREVVDDGDIPKGITKEIYKTPLFSKVIYSEELIGNGDTDLYVKVEIKSYKWVVFAASGVALLLVMYGFSTRKARRNKTR